MPPIAKLTPDLHSATPETVKKMEHLATLALNRDGGFRELEGGSLSVRMAASEAERDAAQALVFGEEAELLTFCVNLADRNLGYGKGLLKKFIESGRALGVRKIFLEVAVGNQAARRLYLGAGFRETGRRKNYYQTGEDACLMTCLI